MMSRGPTLPVAAVLLGSAAILLVVGSNDEGALRTEGSRGPPASSLAGDVPGRAPDLLRGEAEASRDRDRAETSSPDSEADRRRRHKELVGTLESLRTALAQPIKRGEADDERKRTRRRLIEALRRQAQSVEGAWALLDLLAAEQDERTAVRLGRALRNARYGEIAGELGRRAIEGSSALERRGAVIALDLRSPEQWVEPVTLAYERDADGAVREEAANVLGRALRDREQRSLHDQIRKTLVAGLDAEDPAHRLRTLTALMAEARPDAAMRERVEAMRQDEDGRVQREAAALLRVWDGQADRRR